MFVVRFWFILFVGLFVVVVIIIIVFGLEMIILVRMEIFGWNSCSGFFLNKYLEIIIEFKFMRFFWFWFWFCLKFGFLVIVYWKCVGFRVEIVIKMDGR